MYDKSWRELVQSLDRADMVNTRLYLPILGLVLAISSTIAVGQPTRRKQSTPEVSSVVLLNIIRHEDERRWDDELKNLLANEDAKVRKRATLAAGRIGDERAVPLLSEMLLTDKDAAVRDMAAFALGEIESPGGAYALVTVLKHAEKPARARAIEALGKITAAMMAAPATPVAGADNQAPDERLDQCKMAIVDALRFEAERKPPGDRLTILLGLTAVLRIKPDGAGPLVARFLDDADPSIVATALNTMARLRLKDANERVRQLLNHSDPMVRANAARVIGAAEQKSAFEAVLDRALNDQDLRVRASAIRTLAGLKDARAAEPLLDRGVALSKASERLNQQTDVSGRNEILEIVTTLGRLLTQSNSQKAKAWLSELREQIVPTAPEVEVAFARIAPQSYMTRAADPLQGTHLNEGKSVRGRSQAAVAQGVAELATIKTGQALLDANIKEIATNLVEQQLSCRGDEKPSRPAPIRPGSGVTLIGFCVPLETNAVSSFLRAYAALKPKDLEPELRRRLNNEDVIIRATSAELLGEQPSNQSNTQALIDALPRALRDKDSNDAALAILDTLAKQKSAATNDAIKTALDSSDHLVRRRAVALLKTNGAGDFSDRIGTVQTRNTAVDYRRAIARIGHHPTATVVTSRGSFTIAFMPDDAPLTVDNFLQLAKRGYFNGQTIPRVVPNFVVQAGDPRGDQNGGPGYQIRCEINELPYERAALGMALSGKDTGGSQWFVTHSPQPHLDGGYTVFGHVISGMEVVDRIVRGDTIQRVVINDR
jgi:cyclophilin family peptidyl-prolyl cis-trans isomerase/HEAT repeat protein